MQPGTHSHTCRSALWSSLIAMILALLGSIAAARADVPVYTQPPNSAGGQYKSAWYAPDGRDDDAYVWDAFTLPTATAITQIQWRGAYTNYLSGAGLAPVYKFTVAIYPSIAAGSEPAVAQQPLVRYFIDGNAGETPAGSAGGVSMYDYQFTFPSPFQAAAGTKYWVQIIAWQNLTPSLFWPPDWSIARGTGGDGSHFRRVGGTGGMYTFISGDCVFTLLASGGPTATIGASASPAGAGTIMGAGTYPIGSSASLTASASAGWGFVRWTDGATQVSTGSTYTFTVTGNRTLIANFVPAYTITTASSPAAGGTTSGGGIFNQGSSVTVTATPAQGYIFTEWLDFGAPVSTSATYTFTADGDHALVASFTHAPGAVTFDFDNAPVHTSLPMTLTSGGLAATFSATGSGFSIQPVGTVGIAPAGFSGLYLYPNSVFAADLVIDFAAPVVDLSILYSPQELGCDDSATMRVTAFMNGTQVGANTATAPVPGTWPTGTLTIAVPAGFNRAVVHYDHRPPTCQDYGVIFVADNLTVTMLCQDATIADQPMSVAACSRSSASFAVTAGGTEPHTSRWQLETAPGTWIDANDGSLPYNGGTIIATGTTTDLLQLSLNVLPGAPALNFRCIVTNACSSATSDSATLSFACPNIADVAGLGAIPGCDGQLTVDDIVFYLTSFFAGDSTVADLVGLGGTGGADGAITVDDLVAFLAAFFAGCA